VVIPRLDANLEDTLQAHRDNHQRNLEWYAESRWNRFLSTPPVLDIVQVEKECNMYKQKLVDMAEKMLQGHQSYVSFDETEVWMYKLNDVPKTVIGE
jgi:hypothetical protein